MNHQTPKTPRTFTRGFKTLAAVLLLGVLVPWWPASLKAADPVTYSPDACEFEITFPAEPYTVRRCEAENDARCYNLVSYTQTYELNSTVNFRVICNPIAEGVQAKYDQSVSEATVRAMGRKNALKTYNVNYREEEDFRQAGLVGEGETGRTPMIYIAQLWVGKTSVMSVEAELIGEALEEPDQLFSAVMRSVGLKSEESDVPEEKEEESIQDNAQDDAAKD